MQAFGYTVETMQLMLLPLVRELRDPVGSMGNDSALACLSDKPRMLYDYFKQLFAQVTNPAIDSIREEVIMSLECYIGPERNLLETTEEHAHRLAFRTHSVERATCRIKTPQPSRLAFEGYRCHVRSQRGSRRAYQCARPRVAEAEAAIDEGFSIVVLSDRAIGVIACR